MTCTCHDLPTLPVTVLDGGHAPSRAHAGDAGLDLRIRGHADPDTGTEHLLTPEWGLVLEPGERVVALAGFTMALPHGFAAKVSPRSGLAARHGLTVVNSPGLIDAGYRGEVKVVLLNTGTEEIDLAYGDRIAQMTVERVALPAVEVVDALPSGDGRGAAGLGSTGRA